MVMRPKSMATVVVCLSGVLERSSSGTLAWVMIASVLTGGISETEPTSVVLPTPTPPATTIFADTFLGALPGDGVKPMKNPLQEFGVRLRTAADGAVDLHFALLGEVADEHAHHTDGQLDRRGDLGDRPRL